MTQIARELQLTLQAAIRDNHIRPDILDVIERTPPRAA